MASIFFCDFVLKRTQKEIRSKRKYEGMSRKSKK